jgi:hypothetical protein
VRGIGYFDYYNGFEHNADGSEIDQTVTNPADGTVVKQPKSGVAVVQPKPQPDGQAGDVGSGGNGWYSYNLGSWHIVSLNVECAVEPGGCSPTGSRVCQIFYAPLKLGLRFSLKAATPSVWSAVWPACCCNAASSSSISARRGWAPARSACFIRA